MKLKLNHEKTVEITSVELGIDQTELKMLNAGIPLTVYHKELQKPIVVTCEEEE